MRDAKPARATARRNPGAVARTLVAGVALAAAPLARPLEAAAFEPAPCPFALPAGQTEGQSVQCGYLVVPEDRDEPGGRSLRLAVAVFRNPLGTTAGDPIVYLSGGPGASALEGVASSFDVLFGRLSPSGRDVIVFDQRGVGVSQPALDCPLETQGVSQWLGCAATLRTQADLSDYHTAASAADVDDLRQTLGYERVNLWGGSYGTRLALDVMRDFPDGLRSVVLDAVYPPDVDLLVDTPANLQRAIDHLFDSCAADAACAGAYPDLRGTLVAAVTRLDAQPARIRTTDPANGAVYEVSLSGTALLGVLFQFLYVTELIPSLPGMVHDAAAGRFPLVERYLGAFYAQAETSSRGMQFSVLCHDEIVFSSKAPQEAALGAFPLLKPLFGAGVLGTEAYDVCAGWGAGRAEDVENAPVTSAVPTLLLAGDFDPITPPAWAYRAATTLPNGRTFLFPGVGHGAGHDACGRTLLLAFLRDPAAPLDASCIAVRRVQWVLPAGAGAAAAAPELLPRDLQGRVPADGHYLPPRERRPDPR